MVDSQQKHKNMNIVFDMGNVILDYDPSRIVSKAVSYTHLDVYKRQDETWSTGRLYFNMADYREWKEANKGVSKNEEKEDEGKAA